MNDQACEWKEAERKGSFKIKKICSFWGKPPWPLGELAEEKVTKTVKLLSHLNE